MSGTILVAGIALLIAIPLGLLSAVLLSDYAPPRVRTLIKPILETLADHADEFGNRIVGIEPGAGLTAAVADGTIPTYGLDGMEFVTSSTPAMLAELKSALDAGENIAVTLWRPHWAYDEFPIKDLADPEGTLGDAEEIHSIARSGFGADFPELAGWIENWELDSELLYSLENAMYNSGAEASEYEAIVADWIAENQDYVDSLTS